MAAAATAGALDYITAFYGFAVQIYCDFSGYTDMAIGLALIIGMRLPNNFLRPYGAASITEFWRRWHITLSHWLRDYLYIPLGGNRNGMFAQTRNMLITMILGGLWHGANWTFVIWGLLHGLTLAMNHQLARVFGPWAGTSAALAGGYRHISLGRSPVGAVSRTRHGHCVPRFVRPIHGVMGKPCPGFGAKRFSAPAYGGVLPVSPL